MADVPRVDYAVIGGSGTGQLRDDYAGKVLARSRGLRLATHEQNLLFDTPWGQCAPFDLYELTNEESGAAKRFLRVHMHGWLRDRKEHSVLTSGAVFWVLRQAGVRKILVDNSVGSVNALLDPWDLVVCHDVYNRRDESEIKQVIREFWSFGLMRMRDNLCPSLRQHLVSASHAVLDTPTFAAIKTGRPGRPKVCERGVYVTTEGPHFETPAEIADYQRRGFDVVGQSLVPEAHFARAIGACLGSLTIVSNYGEGLGAAWGEHELADFYPQCGPLVGQIILRALDALSDDDRCDCGRYLNTGSLQELMRKKQAELAGLG